MEILTKLMFVLSVIGGLTASWYAFRADYFKLVIVPVAFVCGFCASVAVFSLFYAIITTGIDLFI